MAANPAQQHALEDTRSNPIEGDARIPQIVELAVQGESWKIISAKIGQNEKTIYDLRVRYNLDAYIEQLCRQRHDRFLRKLSYMGDKAIETLQSALDAKDDEGGPPDRAYDAAKFVVRSVQQSALMALKLAELSAPTNKPTSADELTVEELEAIVMGSFPSGDRVADNSRDQHGSGEAIAAEVVDDAER